MNIDSVHLLELFASNLYPPYLQKISRRVGDIGFEMAALLDSADPIAAPEVTMGLRKLLEARDCFMRAALRVPLAQQQECEGFGRLRGYV